MDSFERFECIFKGQKPDKMPIYYPTIACPVASEIMGREVNTGADSLFFNEEKSWIFGEDAHKEFVEKLHDDTISLYRMLKADVVRETLRMRGRPTKMIDENTLLFEMGDGTHIIKKYFEDTKSYGIVEDNREKPKDSDMFIKVLEKEMENYSEPVESELERIYADSLAFKKKADKYFPSIVNGLGLGMNMTDPIWLETLALEPDFMREYYIFKAKSYFPHITFLKSKGYKFINGGGDIAMQNGPIFSPAMFKNVFYDGLKILNDACLKEGMTYCYRTDGNIWVLFDSMFLEIGIPAYGEVDRLADMSVGKIREKSKDLIILGNVSSATLCLGTEEDVRKETRDSLYESGGINYIPGPSNAIVANTPVNNIYAMIDEIEKFV